MNDSIDNATVSHDETPSLADAAVLAVLRRKGIRLARKMDEAVQDEVRKVVGDESAKVSSHLFTEVGSPVRELIKMDNQAYRYHKTETLAWVDKGPRFLPGHKIMHYIGETNKLVDKQRVFLKDEVLSRWDELVQRDMQFRAQAAMSDPDPVKRDRKLARISASEYPSREEMESKFSLTFRLKSLLGDDERVKLSDDVIQRVREDEKLEREDAVVQARQDLAVRMAKPILDAVKKLKVPLDEKGAVFRDSLVNNLYDALEEVKSFAFAADPELDEAIRQANEFLHTQMAGTEALRTTQHARTEAANSLEELAKVFTNLQ